MSGFEMSVSSNIKQVQKQLQNLGKDAIKAASVRALNKTGTSLKAEAARRIKDETGLPVSHIKQKLAVQKASRNRLVWSLSGMRDGTNIVEWVSKGSKRVGAFRKKPGVRSNAWKKAKTYPGTFIGRGKGSGKLLVFKRSGKGISVVHGPSVRRAFYKELQGLQPFALKRFQKVFDQEINYEIKKAFR